MIQPIGMKSRREPRRQGVRNIVLFGSLKELKWPSVREECGRACFPVYVFDKNLIKRMKRKVTR
jgi:hypothetical protein